MALIRLATGLLLTKSDVSVGWLYHGAFAVALGSARARRRYASLHHRDPLDAGVRRGTRLHFRALCLVGWRFSDVAYVAADSVRAHVDAGLRAHATVIRGGVDSDHFRAPSPAEKVAAREALGLGPGRPALVHVARVHPDKAQWILIRAFAEYAGAGGPADLVLAGSGWSTENPEVREWLAEVDLRRVHLCGELVDSRDALWAGDVFCLSSATEALPLSLIEAMMCELVPIVTDVGACRAVVGDAGITVPPGQPAAMASAFGQALDDSKWDRRHGSRARERVLERYSLDRMLNAYDKMIRT